MRVYERSVSPALYVEWHFGGRRHQKSLKAVTGHPVTEKRLAMKIAHRMSRELEASNNRASRRAVFGFGDEYTLDDLFREYHEAREPKWTEHHRKAMRRFRDFWLAELGQHATLREVTAAMVEAGGRKLDAQASTVRKYLLYMTGAYNFAAKKLKWIDARHDLSAVDLPEVRSESRAYTLAEVRRLLPALEGVDPRAGWIGHVAWQSGRRLGAIRTMEKANVEVGETYSVITFPGETDKARNTGKVVVVGRAHELTARLMREPGAYVLGEEPPTEETCIVLWLRKAEKAAKIPHVPGRAWHGLKRRYATETEGIVGRDKQSGTRDDTLRRIYRQDDLEPKRKVAEVLARKATGS